MSNTFDINILVNGNRCKQYKHQGKTFIEAKNGSEYVLEIKNNYYNRILAVSSVDGLNVLTGKTATPDDNGYIIDAYHAEKIKGFRFSDDEWAMFKFGYKFNGKTYAQSKQDGSEVNCGVIGVQLYYENVPLVQYIQTTPCWPSVQWHNPSFYTTCGNSYSVSASYSCHPTYTSNVNYCCDTSAGEVYGSPLRSYNGGGGTQCAANNITCKIENAAAYFSAPANLQQEIKPKGFDMGTEWGRKEASKVNTVSFSRGCLAHSLDIYYASRESLIEMGVPIRNELKVNLPQSFPSKYAEPPKDWVG